MIVFGKPLRAASLLYLLTLGLDQPIVAQDSEGADSDKETPLSTETDVVLVEARLPFVPTSNTIATRLPVELEWTPANVGVVSGSLVEEQNGQILGDACRTSAASTCRPDRVSSITLSSAALTR